MKTKEIKKEIELKSIKVSEIKIPIIGTTPLLMDRMPEKTKEKILAKQIGEGKATKENRNIAQETQDAIHIMEDGNIGFPADGFKFGMMNCTTLVGDSKFSRKLVQALQIVNVKNGLVPIKFKKQTICQHSVGAQTKFSPQFNDWSCELVIRYDANNISANDIVTLLNYAGFYCGIGAWRPKGKDGGTGTYGMYKVNMK